jgi:hypothetical protein
MPEPRSINRSRVGYALLASAAVFLIASVVVASGAIDLPGQTQRIATIALGGCAVFDALLALGFLLKASSS